MGQIRGYIACVCATVVVCAFAAAASATMVRRLSLERLVGEASRIVQATVVDVRSGRDPSGLPATWVTLDVARTLKGPRAGRLTFKQFGTAAPLPDGGVTRIVGLPRYAVGDEVVLFLRGDSRLGFTSPVGFAQGTYRVRRVGQRARVRRDATGRGGEDLDDLLSRVVEMVGGGR